MATEQRRFLGFNSIGLESIRTAIIVSEGSSDADKLVALDAQGRLDPSLIPSTISSTIQRQYIATEAIPANRFVNIYDNSGTTSVRLASHENGYAASGFVTVSVADTEMATIFLCKLEVTVTGVVGAAFGLPVFLGESGQIVSAVPSFTEGRVWQQLGKYVDTDVFILDPTSIPRTIN